jgi:hypothetical protein
VSLCQVVAYGNTDEYSRCRWRDGTGAYCGATRSDRSFRQNDQDEVRALIESWPMSELITGMPDSENHYQRILPPRSRSDLWFTNHFVVWSPSQISRRIENSRRHYLQLSWLICGQG